MVRLIRFSLHTSLGVASSGAVFLVALSLLLSLSLISRAFWGTLAREPWEYHGAMGLRYMEQLRGAQEDNAMGVRGSPGCICCAKFGRAQLFYRAFYWFLYYVEDEEIVFSPASLHAWLAELHGHGRGAQGILSLYCLFDNIR